MTKAVSKQKPELVVTVPFFNQPESKLLEYYNVLASSAADQVLLRDVSCQKREPSTKFYKRAVRLLQKNDKTVVLNTLPILRQKDKAFHRLLPSVDLVEVNNIGYLPFLKNRKVVLGPSLRIYNSLDFGLFQDCKVDRLVAPYGLTRTQSLNLFEGIPCEKELFVFGLESVALSWDCFLASFLGKNRVNCQKVCFNHPRGLNISSLNNLPLFKAMGVEVLSQKVYSILNHVESLKEKGVKYFRVNPCMVFENEETESKLKEIKQIISGKQNAKNLKTPQKCNGTFFEKTPGFEYIGD